MQSVFVGEAMNRVRISMRTDNSYGEEIWLQNVTVRDSQVDTLRDEGVHHHLKTATREKISYPKPEF